MISHFAQVAVRVPRRIHPVRRLLVLATALALVAAVGCVHVFWRTEARALRASLSRGATHSLSSPVKAHLADGSTVVFRRGALVSADRITGAGESYALLSSVATRRDTIPMDSVVGLETFEGKVLAAPTAAVSLAATAGGFVATGLLLLAIFGSCPTVYADTGTGPVLEAEGFSYAIAPLLEHRDLDALRVRPDFDGVLRLELRNEALETHFINHTELIRVRHAMNSRVVPDQSGRPLVVTGFQPLASATDRARRDVRDALSDADGHVFSSASAVVGAAREGDLDDWIDIDAANLPPGDSVAVVLRLRNSLLNTVLLYEGMLGGRDAADWLANGLQHIASVVDLSRWYVRTMGMRASVAGIASPGGDVRAGFVRLADVGPLAFRDVAIVLPRPRRDAPNVRVQLRFVADNWRIDHAMVAGRITRPAWTSLPVARVVVPTPARGGGPIVDTAAVSALAEADDRYLETRPGQRMTLVFASPPPTTAGGDSSTTYLIAWQGWYREWIRGQWLAEPTRTTPFVLGDAAVLEALRRFTAKKAEFERAFYASRVPVR